MKSAVFKSKIKLLSLLFAFLMTFSCVGMTAQAQSVSSLRDEKNKIQQGIDNAQKEIDALSSEISDKEEYLSALRKKIDLLQDKIDNLESSKQELQKEIDAIQDNITKTENLIKSTQAEIDKKQAEFDENYELYCQRLRAMYVSGTVSNLEIILSSSDMSTILTRSQMIKSVSEQDSKALDELMKKMEEIESKKQELEIKRNELTEDKAKLDENKKSLQSSIDEINASKSEVDAEAAEANALIKELAASKQDYSEYIDTNTERLRQVENEIRQALSNSSSGSGTLPGSSGNGSGKLGYPTDSRTVSAGFPYYASGGYHGGVDFPVPVGSNVYAAADGVVISVKYLWTYSYGNYLIIDHGNGLSTLYAHNSSINVSVGQRVSRGQVVASSGNTGNSSGPHCHFEVRVNGTQVNPFNYL